MNVLELVRRPDVAHYENRMAMSDLITTVQVIATHNKYRRCHRNKIGDDLQARVESGYCVDRREIWELSADNMGKTSDLKLTKYLLVDKTCMTKARYECRQDLRRQKRGKK